jgi:hypothetical protein
MKKSSHAWNSFKESWTDEGKEYVFGVQKRVTESRPDGSRLVETTYKDLWCSSTDYSEATDRLRHEVAIPVAEYWMNKCGIPRILQMIVRGTCFAPRPIVFEAYGPMGAYGEEWTEDSPFRNPRFVMLRQGVLMGDPLTKVCLHLVNILVRIVGANYSKQQFIRKIFPFESTEVSLYLKRYCEDPTPPSLVVRREVEIAKSPPSGATEQELEEPSVSLSNEREQIDRLPIMDNWYSAKTKPVKFTPSDSWMRLSPKFEVKTQNGNLADVTISAKPPSVKQLEPAVARTMNFRPAEIRNAFLAYDLDQQRKLRVSQELAQRVAIQKGFRWNLSNLNKVDVKSVSLGSSEAKKRASPSLSSRTPPPRFNRSDKEPGNCMVENCAIS